MNDKRPTNNQSDRVEKTWDEIIEPRATSADIDEEVFRMYLQMAKEKGRFVLGLTATMILALYIYKRV